MDSSGRLALFLAAAGVVCAQTKLVERQQPEALTFEELRTLSGEAVPAGDLGTKLQRLLTTPAIDNTAALGGASRCGRSGQGWVR